MHVRAVWAWKAGLGAEWVGPYFGYNTVDFMIGESLLATKGGHYAQWLRTHHPDVIVLYQPTGGVRTGPRGFGGGLDVGDSRHVALQHLDCGPGGRVPEACRAAVDVVRLDTRSAPPVQSVSRPWADPRARGRLLRLVSDTHLQPNTQLQPTPAHRAASSDTVQDVDATRQIARVDLHLVVGEHPRRRQLAGTWTAQIDALPVDGAPHAHPLE